MIRIFFQYYQDPNPERQVELDICLQENLRHPDIAECVVVSAHPLGTMYKLYWVHPARLAPPQHPSGRPTFSQMFALARELSEPDDINVICNSDICFDSSLKHCLGMKQDEFYALGRWDVDGHKTRMWDVSYGQDAWIFRGKPKPMPCDFPFGYPGCDNRVAWEARHAGYRVSNPCVTIRALHRHASGVRNYPANAVHTKGCPDRIPKPGLRVPPTALTIIEGIET